MQPGTGKKVLVAMSGGVDSSVTAALLKDEGYEVVGCFMRSGEEAEEKPTAECRVPGAGLERPDRACATAGSNPEPGTPDPELPPAKNRQGCCSVNDAADARLVAAILGIPFYVLNFRKDFTRIKDYFTAEYNAGRTPNPCVRCNDWLKFGKLFDYARSIDADFIATGHYARVVNAESSPKLLRGVDHHKDQSYVLFGMKPDRLARMLLPIGHLRKPAVRQMAHDKNLPVFNKPDSYEICFVPDNDYRGFLQRRDAAAFHPGKIVDSAGAILGEHDGHQNFTIGQRRGLPVNRSFPLYVIAKDAAANTITLGPREESHAGGLPRANQTNWLISPPREPLRCTAKIRSNAEPVPATVTATGDDALELTFDEPQHAVTPGQAAVCYAGEEMIGGGWIVEASL